VPEWLVLIARLSLILAGLSSLIILFDVLAGHKQHMWIMNVVWPLTALWSGPVGLYYYFKLGRRSTHHQMMQAEKKHQKMPAEIRPFRQTVGLAASHCGAGCTLGDLLAEWFIFFVPFTLFGRTMFAGWVLDYLVAFSLGIVFQYFTIKPMRHLSVSDGIKQAIKADTLSITSWQVGMYGWMAIAMFLILGKELPKTNPVFWFMMQLAMVAGFLTSFPVNAWLIQKGIKEKM
jgi:hypothetical protein